MPDLLPHKYNLNQQTGTAELTEVKDYIRYQAKGQPVVYLQAGRFEYDGGVEVPREDLEKMFGPKAVDRCFKEGIPPATMLPPEAVLAEIEEARKTKIKVQAQSRAW